MSKPDPNHPDLCIHPFIGKHFTNVLNIFTNSSMKAPITQRNIKYRGELSFSQFYFPFVMNNIVIFKTFLLLYFYQKSITAF